MRFDPSLELASDQGEVGAMAPAQPGRLATGRACITPLGHATALIELGGVAILTDPVLSSAVGPRVGRVIVGPRRRLPPARELSELPAIDLVLVSHAHWDHADAATLARLPQSAAACVHRRNRDLVRRFADVRELGWGEATDLDGAERSRLRVTAIPSRHWGARMLVDHWRGYGGFLVEALDVESPRWPGRPLSVVFAGDTAMTDAYKELRARRGAGVDVALMPIGAYDPWIMNHCSPEQAWRMGVEHLEAERLVPIHYDTFRLSNEPVGDPLRRLREAAEAAGEPDRLAATAYGERLVIG